MIAKTNMAAKARRAREMSRLVRIHPPACLRVIRCDLKSFREALVRAYFGLLVRVDTGLLFVSILSVAVFIRASEAQLRLVTAWAVVAGRLLIAIAGPIYADALRRHPCPLRLSLRYGNKIAPRLRGTCLE